VDSLAPCSLLVQGDPHLSSLEVFYLPVVNRWVIIAYNALWAYLEDGQCRLIQDTNAYLLHRNGQDIYDKSDSTRLFLGLVSWLILNGFIFIIICSV